MGGDKALFVMIWQKVQRIRSLLELPGESNFEGIDDSLRDLINYASFMVEYREGKMEGQPGSKKDGCDIEWSMKHSFTCGNTRIPVKAI